jgi:hypothetical protein
MWSQFNNNFPGAIQCLNADSLSSLEDSPMKVEECHTLEQLYRALCQRGVLRVALLNGQLHTCGRRLRLHQRTSSWPTERVSGPVL